MAERVHFGVYVPQVGFSYEQVLERARACEELGISSLWLFDHLYSPGLPEADSFEAWTLATSLLAQTTRLRVGHLVLCNSFRHPALLAKMATTLDVISGGRLDLGIGSGSFEEEHRRAGLPWGSGAERAEQLGETLEVLERMLSTDGPTTFDGRHYRVEGLFNRPGPVQKPRPPIHIGGAGERRTLPLVARYADVWNVPTYALGELRPKRDALLRECERIGRDPTEITMSLEAVLVLAGDEPELAEARQKAERRFPGPGWGLEEGGYIGAPDAVIDRIAEHLELGFTSFVFFTHDRARPATLALLAESVMPAFAGYHP